MKTLLSSDKRTQELNLKQFEIRKAAKLCICFICFIQILYRIPAIFWDLSCTPKSVFLVEISLPLCAMMIIIISLEYFLFKKKGPSVVKYSNLVDLALLLLFVGDWISYLLSSLYKIEETSPPSFKISSLFGFTAFAWRTLLVTLLVQKWQLKIIAPITATFVVSGYAIHYSHGNLEFLVLRAIIQLLSIILIIYCEDKVKWKLMRTNLEQEKWMQVNNFILDSIPEKIMILDLNGEAKFMSEYCKTYLKKFNLSIDVKELFKSVRDLQQLQQYDFDPSNASKVTPTTKISKMATWNDLYIDLKESEPNVLKVETLQDLIANFPNLMKSKNLQERQFLVYNGKFKTKLHQPEKSVEMRISFVQHYQNSFIILILRDMTQRDLLVTLEETSKYKDQLLASVSHELRAPLNGNINFIEGAIHSPETPEMIKETLLIPALRSSKFLLHIINDILDMSQIKQKKLRLSFESEDLKETLKGAAQLVEIQAKKKGLKFSVELDPTLPQKFCTDHLRVSQIVLNLLTNAIKFTHEGTIKFIAAPFEGTSSVKISIEDSGIGINQENIKKLFSQNTIIDCKEKEKMNNTGAGLGLSVAYNLVQLLAPEGHKKIDVISTPNQGSIFIFVLENKPLQRAFHKSDSSTSSYESTEELTVVVPPKVFDRVHTLNSPCSSSTEIGRQESQPLTDACCSCPQVLIVDDNPFNTMTLETILKSLKISCDSVYGGSSALQKLLSRENKPCGDNCRSYSAIFMDQEMPGMSGNETVKEIKKMQEENQVSADIRIIGCTAHKGKEEVERFLASGLESCIFKPVSIGIIKEKLKDILD